jgi:hypothetical protein
MIAVTCAHTCRHDCSYVCIYAGHDRACVIMCVREQAQLVVHMRVGMIVSYIYIYTYIYTYDSLIYIYTHTYIHGIGHIRTSRTRFCAHTPADMIMKICAHTRGHDHVNVCEPRGHDLAYVYRQERVSMIASMYTTHKRVHAHTCMYIHISLFMPTRVYTYT